MNDAQRRPRLSSVLGALAVVLVAAACVRLGFWQLDRGAQRRALNANIAARLEAPPTTLDEALRDTTGLSYRSIELVGRFDNDRSIVLPGRAYQGSPGVHLLTPLLVGPGGLAVLVNRGWIATPDAASVDPGDYREPGMLTVDGMVLAFPGANQSLAARASVDTADHTFRRVWFTIDERALRRQFDYTLAKFIVQALPAADAPAVPVRLPPPPLDPGPHLGYAIQWFSFATIAVIGSIALARSNAERERKSRLRSQRNGDSG